MVNGNRRWVLFFLLGACFFAPWAWAWGPQDTFSYQGELRANGEPFDGFVTLTFRLYDSELGGQEFADEVTFDDVQVASERQLEPTSDRMPGDRRDHRLAHPQPRGAHRTVSADFP